MNQIQLTAALNYELAADSKLIETLYTTAEYPTLEIDGADLVYKVQMWHSMNGSLCGRMLFTDHDIPIVAKLDDGIYALDYDYLVASPLDTYATYVPWPIKWKGTSYDTHGKMSNVDISVSNVNQTFSNIVLTHNALRKRKVKIYTVYLSSATELNLNAPIHVNANITVHAGVVDASGTAIDSEILPFGNALFDANEDKIQEFEGLIDNISMDGESANITVVNYLDYADTTMVPQNLYNRGRCQFIYKGPKCRFISNLELVGDLSDIDGYIRMVDLVAGKTPFEDLQPEETHIILIGNEQILINTVNVASSTIIPQSTYGQFTRDQIRSIMANNTSTAPYTVTAVTRGYNDTLAAAHASGTAVDIILCRKTFHDCRVHFHEKYYGGFPAIPKSIYNQ